jgi:hypothetical protein
VVLERVFGFNAEALGQELDREGQLVEALCGASVLSQAIRDALYNLAHLSQGQDHLV